MLSVEHIHVYRGRTYVLQDVSMHIEAGEIVALIGSNGAGKTTTLHTVSGLLRPKQGQLLFRSAPAADPLALHATAPEDIVKLGVNHVPEGRQVFAGLTVRENLLLGAYLRRDKAKIRQDMAQVFALFPILGERLTQAAGSLSGGEQMMLALGRALMSEPRLLLLDEPSLGLAPKVVDMVFRTLVGLHARGVTLLLVEQNARIALELADRAYVLENGRIALSGSGRDLIANPKVQHAYLGKI